MSRSKQDKSTLPSTKKPEYTYDQLLQALYWIWDGFDRALMPMFLVYDTAESVLGKRLPEGNTIFVGVRNNEWTAGARTILYNFTGDPIEKTPTHEVFKNPFNGVLINVYRFNDDPCILNTQTVMYEREYFQLPNTYEQFIERFGQRE